MTIQDIPFPRHIGIKHAKDYVLPQDLAVEQWYVPKGTTVRIFQAQNFGYVVLKEVTADVRGFPIPRRIFRW